MKASPRDVTKSAFAPKLLAMAGVALLAALPTAQAFAAEIPLPTVSVGAGMRSSFTHTSVDGAAEDPNDFNLNSARLYLGGTVNDYIKFTLNTEYDNADSKVQVIDAIARFEFSPQVNIWAGRFLPPSDRANLNGPYYSNEWGFATEGVQDGFPFFAAGRDNGVAYWGDFEKLKVSAGFFDVPSTTGDSKVVSAARVQYDFWDAEPGYYLNGTYYGEKNILALGASTQLVSGDNAYTIDGIMEKKLAGGGVVTLSAEYAKYDGFGGYGVSVPFTKSDGYFGLASYLFPTTVGVGKLQGKFQILGKYASSSYDAGGPSIGRNTAEVDVNYIIKAFNARLSLFYIDTSFDDAPPSEVDSKQIGLGLQIQI
ncbi:MAG: porin [Pseudomonadota bacterium]